jgi:NADH-quinone oxidoreductase subunit G
VLGTQLGLPGFEFDNPEALRAALPAVSPDKLSNALSVTPQLVAPEAGLQRVADVPAYFTDAIVRRAEALQLTNDARPPRLSANSRVLSQAGLRAGDKARVRQGDASALLEVLLDDRLPDGVVRVPAGHASTSTLGAMFGAVSLERA